MALEDDFRAAIDKNIPAEVGTLLQERLVQADLDSGLVNDQRKEIIALKRQLDDLQHIQSRWNTLQDDEKALASKQKVIERNEVRLEILEEQMKRRLQDNMTLLTQVFKGPASKMAFELWGNANGLMTSSGMTSNPGFNLSGSIDPEAQP